MYITADSFVLFQVACETLSLAMLEVLIISQTLILITHSSPDPDPNTSRSEYTVEQMDCPDKLKIKCERNDSNGMKR